ncbi:MAG: FAD/NAD(P)-binding protein [Candidatus Heimdallarchaeota archaeon]|nr:FAD/NAD(P)-binding protein [Candidatus Heimdallarchaeota archaeon]
MTVTPKKIRENPFLPFDAKIIGIDQLNPEAKNYKLDCQDLRDMYYEPGQFMQVTVYGVGECVIGITDTIYNKGFELAIQNTGGMVTSYIDKMEVGATLGLRGPFGNPFPMESFKGRNMLFIGAGIGFWPIRSSVKHVLANREEYGEVLAIFGVRKPDLFTFVEDIDRWISRDDMRVQRTVDSCCEDDGWTGDVGLITKLTDELEISDPENWIVLCCGPPVAFKFIGQSLNSRGFHDDQIYVSLERKMKCGIGLCNQCLIGGNKHVCIDGPIFTLGEAKNMSGGLD